MTDILKKSLKGLSLLITVKLFVKIVQISLNFSNQRKIDQTTQGNWTPPKKHRLHHTLGNSIHIHVIPHKRMLRKNLPKANQHQHPPRIRTRGDRLQNLHEKIHRAHQIATNQNKLKKSHAICNSTDNFNQHNCLHNILAILLKRNPEFPLVNIFLLYKLNNGNYLQFSK